MATNLTEKSEAKLDTSSQLAALHTSAAYEPTMMAWIRTATSMITFGFAVYKFLMFKEIQVGRTIILSDRVSSE